MFAKIKKPVDPMPKYEVFTVGDLFKDFPEEPEEDENGNNPTKD